MVKHCVKCRGRLIRGAETCVICGQPVTQVAPPTSVTKATPVVSFRSPAGALGPQIHFVTAPGGRRIEDSSTAKSYKTR